MSVGKYTIENAPTDVAILRTLSRWNLRLLMTELGKLPSPTDVSTFMQGSVDQMADAVAATLLEHRTGAKPPVTNGVTNGASNGTHAVVVPVETPKPVERTPVTAASSITYPSGEHQELVKVPKRMPATANVEPAQTYSSELATKLDTILESQAALLRGQLQTNTEMANFREETQAVLQGLATQNQFLFTALVLTLEAVSSNSRSATLREIAQCAPQVGDDLLDAIKYLNPTPEADEDEGSGVEEENYDEGKE